MWTALGISPICIRNEPSPQAATTGLSGANKPNGVLMEELGLLEYMADRFLVGGTPDECVEQLRRIHAAGAKNLWPGVHMADKDTFMNTLAAKIALKLPV